MPASRSPFPATLIAAMLLAPALALFVARALVADLQGPAARPAATATIAPEALDGDPRPEIRGRILDADGDPVRGAAVRLVSARLPYTIYADAKSDAVGKFSFADAWSERVRVVADHDPEGAVTSAELQLAPGRGVEITLVLSPASSVRG